MDHQENAPNTPMTDLDQMVSDDQIQILKAAIPYVSPSGQRLLSVYSKRPDPGTHRPGHTDVCHAADDRTLPGTRLIFIKERQVIG